MGRFAGTVLTLKTKRDNKLVTWRIPEQLIFQKASQGRGHICLQDLDLNLLGRGHISLQDLDLNLEKGKTEEKHS